MSSNLYVGNLSFDVEAKELEELFSPYGEVVSANLITDRQTGRSRGFGFVEMGQSEDATKAIEALDGKELKGRNLTVNVAKPRNTDSIRIALVSRSVQLDRAYDPARRASLTAVKPAAEGRRYSPASNNVG